MKHKILTVFIILTSIIGYSQEVNKKKITITYTRSYCGGARPNDEIINALNQPKVLANCKIKLESDGKIKKKFKGRTNEKGELEIKIKKGKYILYIASNEKNKSELPFDKSCKKLRKKALSNFEISDKETSIEIRIPCNPCDPSLKERR
ncbi:MAG: hypothetical protein ACK5D5_13290 [Bacteroidota bacterium]|jgi:hypothetical protein